MENTRMASFDIKLSLHAATLLAGSIAFAQAGTITDTTVTATATAVTAAMTQVSATADTETATTLPAMATPGTTTTKKDATVFRLGANFPADVIANANGTTVVRPETTRADQAHAADNRTAAAERREPIASFRAETPVKVDKIEKSRRWKNQAAGKGRKGASQLRIAKL